VSNTGVAPSQFEAVEQPVGSQFDLSRVDRNLQQISTVEQAWDRPALPEMVKADLASMPDVTEAGLFAFLTGIDDVLRKREQEDEQPDQSVFEQLDPIQNRGLDQVQIVLADLSNNPAPQAVTGDAVKRFKLRAISKGFLDMDETKVDSTWSPEFNQIRGQMAFEDQNERLRGDRLGAVPLSGVNKLLNDFTSPTGLLSAATQLDLWWDTGAIGREWTSWGDKWRAVGEADNPIEWGAKLFDALTGPIDDIVLPVVNIGLMFVGIGAVANTARIGWQVGRGLKTLEGLEEIYRASKLARLTGASAAVRNFGELGRASSLAGRLSRTSKMHWAGEAMTRWRSMLGTRVAKGIIQPGMRLGMASQLESRMGSFKGGNRGLADAFEPIEGLSERLYLASVTPVMVLPEILIAPYNIFAPGTFMRSGGEGLNLLSRAGAGAHAALGSIPGRAAIGAVAGAALGTATGEGAGDILEGAAIGAGVGAAAPALGTVLRTGAGQAAAATAFGAGAGVLLGDDPEDILVGAGAGLGLFVLPPALRSSLREDGWLVPKGFDAIGRGLQTLSFRPVSDQHEISMAFHNGRVSWFENAIQQAPDEAAAERLTQRLNAWNSNVRLSGVRRALAIDTGHNDDEAAAAEITWSYLSAMIDHISNVQAHSVAGPWKGRQLQGANKLVSQLRPFHPELGVTDDLLDDMATAIAYTEKGGKATRRSVKARRIAIRAKLAADPGYALEVANAHNKRGLETMHQLFSQTNLPKLPDNTPFIAPVPFDAIGLAGFHRMPMDERSVLMQHYMPNFGDTFGNWPQFTTMLEEIHAARRSGLLDDAELVPAFTRTGHRSHITDVQRWERPAAVDQANESLTDTILDLKDPAALNAASVSPAAPSVLPGRVTVGRTGTPWKRQLFELREEIIDVQEASKLVERLENMGLTKRTLGEMADLKANDLSRGTIDRLLRDFFPSAPAAPGMEARVRDEPAQAFRKLFGFAKRHNLSIGEIRAYVAQSIDDMAADAEKWAKAGLSGVATDEVGRELRGIEALARRRQEITEMLPYVAAEVDVAGLAAKYRAADNLEAAEKVEQLALKLKADGYDLVHGVEFLMPEDLTRLDMFQDISRRHMNAATLGNFFKGRLPIEAHILENARQRASLVKHLAGHDRFKDMAPDDPRIDGVLRLLRRYLRDTQSATEEMTRNLHRQTLSGRTISRIKSSMTPVRLDDLQQKKGEIIDFLLGKGVAVEKTGRADEKLMEAIRGLNLTPDEAESIWRATIEFRNASFRDLGLYAIEAKLRSQNQFAGALKLMGRSTLGAAIGGYTGAQVGRMTAGEDASFEEQLGRVVLGGAAGAAAGYGLAKGAKSLMNAGERSAIQRAENWRYGYMADNLARARDSLRFTMSPFFDASRYTEGIMLAQTGAPLRNAAGERLILPLNMTPRGLRRRLAKELGSADAARQQYDSWIGQFQKFARDHQDFDPEALDSTGRWFKQVGILGFSPVDWMGTAFAHLMREKLDPADAYDAVRRMYTYATGRGVGRGRSAAEMSVNFLFFPFSFQKKALTHMAKWMHDDLSRSIMIHDALKTYEILDEEWNLDERWRDYAPWLMQLQKLNLFAYGLSAGRFGGINSQMLESGGKLGWNLFVPAGLDIKDVSAAEERQDVIRNLLPALNDINWMLHNMEETGNIFVSPAHVTRAGEVRAGYDAWNKFRTSFSEQLAEKGYTLEDIHNKPWLAEAKAYYDGQRAALRDRYPAWFRAQQESLGEIEALNMQRAQHLARFNAATQAGVTPKPDDQMVAEMDALIDGYRSKLQLVGIDDLSDAPPEVFDDILRRSAEFARRNPRWVTLWDEFFSKEFGPITTTRSF
jgi:hypothetical protein